MRVRISLTLEASEMFLSLHMIFSLEKDVVVWSILERISGFGPSLEMIATRYLKFSTSSSLCFFNLISLWKPFGLVWTDLYFVPYGGSIKMVYKDASFFFLFRIYDNVICKAEQNLRARLGSRKTGLNPPPNILILTIPRRYFCRASLLLLVLAVRIYTLVHLLY